MVGFVVVTHGSFAEGLLSSAVMIMGKQEQLKAVGLYEDADLEQFSSQICEAVSSVDTGDGVLIFTDMFGASPFNFSVSNIPELTISGHKMELLTGVNLPMLLEGLAGRSDQLSVNEIMKNGQDIGREGIRNYSLTNLETYEDDED